MFRKLKAKGFEVLTLHHAEAILKHDMHAAVAEIENVLSEIRIPVEELVRGGGGEGQLTQRIRRDLATVGWIKHIFEIQKIVDGVQKESISHEIDHVKVFNASTFALEIEWNNKDPFYDRDLENFKRLHAEGAISIGGIVTLAESRCTKACARSLRDLLLKMKSIALRSSPTSTLRHPDKRNFMRPPVEPTDLLPKVGRKLLLQINLARQPLTGEN